MTLPMGVTISDHYEMTIQDMVEYAQLAEELGYDGFWLTEDNTKDAFVVLGVIAGQTKRIRLGTGIVNIYSRTPTTLALSASTVANAAKGRFFLALGTGGVGFMTRGHGIKIEKPLQRMREYVSIIRRLIAGERVSHDSELFHIEQFHLRQPAKDAEVPIYVSALNEKMTQLAGEIGDGVYMNFIWDRYVKDVVRPRLEAGRARAAQPRDNRTIYTLAIAPVQSDDPAAFERVQRRVTFYCASEHYHRVCEAGGFLKEAQRIKETWEGGDQEGATAMVTPQMAEAFTLYGPRERVELKLRRYADAGIYPVVYPVPRHGRTKRDYLDAITYMADYARGAGIER
ncbi:MAG: LLM class flavin-dependent oxidoreductase [Candidatus Tectomicrobia bacterium]|nr:LLM class flavin-dependent oxidoreductase [Candidatus Tectomicrobia bacterium]